MGGGREERETGRGRERGRQKKGREGERDAAREGRGNREGSFYHIRTQKVRWGSELSSDAKSASTLTLDFRFRICERHISVVSSLAARDGAITWSESACLASMRTRIQTTNTVAFVTAVLRRQRERWIPKTG